MSDRVTEAFAALERVEPPLFWSDVSERVLADDDVHVAELVGAPRPHGTRRRGAAVFVAAAAVVAVAVAGVRGVAHRDDRQIPPAVASGGSPTSPTTAVVSPTSRIFPVTAWTGRTYVVWGGADGNAPGHARADGWSYDPTTGETTSIPAAPIAPRSQAAGVWTGTELIVCCGTDVRHDNDTHTDTAAAYTPATRTWRVLADPPPGSGRGFPTAVWTGQRMLVIFGASGREPAAIAYDPATNRWRTLASPPAALTPHPHAVWTGHEVVAWGPSDGETPDNAYRYDSATDSWTALPPLPDAYTTYSGSIVWTGDELVVYGVALDGRAGVGARLRVGDDAWRPFADPGPIRPEGGVAGSQTLLWDGASHRAVVWGPATGTSSGEATPPLLSFDPDQRGTWRQLAGVPGTGIAPDLTIGDGLVLQPDRAHPVVARVQ